VWVKALTFQAPESIRYESVPEPRIEEPGDVIVRVKLSAVCGSDLHVWRGNETGLDAGTVLGHEFLGDVVEVGSEVRGLPSGTQVVSPFTTNCGSCFYCREGLTARCTRGALFGWVEAGHGLHGAQAEYVRVPHADATLMAVPAGSEPEQALLCGDVLSTGFFCAEMGGVRAGTTTVVIGCGPVGLMAVVAARELGCERVFAVDSLTERLQLARDFGATAVDRGADDPLELVRAVTDGRGADCVLEAVGSPQATRLAVDLVRPGGTVAAGGVHTERHFAFSPGEAYDKNLTYRAGRCPARAYMQRAGALVSSGKVDLSALYSHRMPLSEGARAYRIFDQKLEGCTKVLLHP
jgi:2-desacetyl-2-hydroxyethyl bacteriochlorophyllide A dehydrogenase